MNKYLNPKNYLNKAWSCLNKVYYERLYDLDCFRKIERGKFEKAGFSYDDSLKKLNQILDELNKPDFASQKGMGSIHWILFCCISRVASIKSILEIGTFDGETALVLSRMFPNADIVTIDLPDDDPIFSTSYQRDNAEYRSEFRDRQKRNLSDNRIKFFNKNSFFVPSLTTQKFDLIWVDGGHLYPEIAWDICNVYHLCNLGGWIMCDDVIPNKNGFRNKYASPDSYEVLEYVKERTGDEITYFLKRESPEWSADPKKRKYVAVMKKLE